MSELFDPETGELKPEATPDSVLVCFALYQQCAAKNGWAVHRFLTEPQRKAIKARLAEAGGMAEWREALDLASRSEWLCGKIIGKSGTRFRMDLNFMVRPASFARILDGYYTRDEPKPKLVLSSMQPPHLKPQPAFVPEHPDIRDAAAIISWRSVGRYDKANEVEERFAKRQGRPPVLVPAPELAGLARGEQTRPAVKKPPIFDDIPWDMDMVPE